MAADSRVTPASELLALQKELVQDASKLAAGLTPGKPRTQTLARTFRLIVNLELLARSQSRLAAQGEQDALLEHVGDVAGQIAAQVNSLSLWQSAAETLPWVTRYRLAWRKHSSLFIMIAAVFLATCLIGWHFGTSLPDYAPLLIGQQGMENILQKNAWFESARSESLMVGLPIAYNNIKVALNCFLAGALLGLGGLVLMAFNGLHFGCILGFCYVHHFQTPLLQFVVSHGGLELSIIVAATFAGVLFGRAFYMRPFGRMATRMVACAPEAFLVFAGCAPWLLLAGAIEACVSPFSYLSFSARIAVGVTAAALFWGWTFWPLKAAASRQAARPSPPRKP